MHDRSLRPFAGTRVDRPWLGQAETLDLPLAADPCGLPAHDAGNQWNCEVGQIATTAAVLPQSVTTVRVLGHGRAAEARLVRMTIAPAPCGSHGQDQHDRSVDGEASQLCVEKVFCPGLLTRLIYRIAFQAPFAYQDNADAILASFYRRRVAASIVQAMIPEARVAQPLYVRWDQQSRAMVLASEYIRGRGITPASADPRMLRRLAARLLGRSEKVAAAPAEEIDDLLDLMTRLESLLVECGLTGSGWQVCKRAMVSTANLLRTDNGYVVVDLESGIPSVLVPRYVWAGLRSATLPLFDDLDAEKLRHWVRENRPQLAFALAADQLERLNDDVERLISHNENWKRSEPAIGRQPWRLFTADFRQRLKARILQSWRRREIVDATHHAVLQRPVRFFTSLTFLLGLIPGPVGQRSQRLWANAEYRRQIGRYLRDAAYRRERRCRFITAKSQQWREHGRIAPDARFPSLSTAFVGNWLLSKLTPTVLHRLISDRDYRGDRVTRMFLFCVSGSFQSRLGRLMIQTRIERWREQRRLTDTEAEALHRQLDSAAVDEYVRCFGLHLGLKLLMPVVMSLKIGGAAASVASGNPAYFLLMLMLLPMLRTATTLWRMMSSGRPVADYRDALVVGILPVIGSLAYPVQMYAKFPALSLFLMRDFAGRVGCWLPIYGGKDSRTELAAIKSVNLIAEGLELWLAANVFSQRGAAAATAQQDDAVLPMSIKIRRWDRLASEQLERLSQEAAVVPCSPRADSEPGLVYQSRSAPRRRLEVFRGLVRADRTYAAGSLEGCGKDYPFLLIGDHRPGGDLVKGAVATATDATCVDSAPADTWRSDRHSELRIDRGHDEGNGPSICKRLRHRGQRAGVAERLSCSGGGTCRQAAHCGQCIAGISVG